MPTFKHCYIFICKSLSGCGDLRTVVQTKRVNYENSFAVYKGKNVNGSYFFVSAVHYVVYAVLPTQNMPVKNILGFKMTLNLTDN